MKRHAAPIIAAILLLLPVLYVGSYLALVAGPRFTSTVLPSGQRETRITNYRIGDGRCDWLFWPVEETDRQLRPAAWGKRPRGGVYR